MKKTFKPYYTITPQTLKKLMEIEAVKERVVSIPLTPTVLSSLRESSRIYTTHYSTMIEGNRLKPEQIEKVLMHKGHFPGREREEAEVKGYYAALDTVEKVSAQDKPLTEKLIQTIHALVMGAGLARAKPTPYRTGQNVIRDGRDGAIVYMPPEAQDVSALMAQLVTWIEKNQHLPVPLLAAIAHYQYATIHPYYDGNGRTARLITTFLLHRGGYDLKGLYCLEEYYARNLGAYYDAISIGPSHNYYLGREEADITPWIDYFIEGMAYSFERVLQRMLKESDQSAPDISKLIKSLDPKQRKIISLFEKSDTITANDISTLFGFQPRTGAHLCKQLVDAGFLEIANPSNKKRSYRLSSQIRKMLK